MEKQRAKRHHTVSKFVLKRFADETTGKLHCFNKRTRHWGTVGPKSATVEIDYYTINDGIALSDVVELELSRIENVVAPIISNISPKSEPDVETRDAIAAFLALLVIRTRPFRECQREIGDIATTVEQSLEYIDSIEPELACQFPQDEIDRLREDFRVRGYGMTFPMNFDVQQFKERQAMFGSVMRSMEWRLETTKSDEKFVTSDSPVAVRNSHRLYDPYAVGITREDLDVELTFPLSPDMCLLLSWKNRFGWHRRVPKTRVQEINRRTTVCADTYVFASERSQATRATVEGCADHFVRPVEPKSTWEAIRVEHKERARRIVK